MFDRWLGNKIPHVMGQLNPHAMSTTAEDRITSHCDDFSCGVQVLGMQASVVVTPGL